MAKPPRSSDSPTIRATTILIAVIALLYLAREILIPLAFALTLTLVLSPAVDWLERIRLGRVPAVLIAMVVSIALAGGISLVLFNQVIGVVNELPRYKQNIQHKIEAMGVPARGTLGRATQSVRELGETLSGTTAPAIPAVPDDGNGNAQNRPVPVQIVETRANEIQYLRDLTRPFLAPLGVLGIVLIFSVFMLIEQDDLRNRLFRLAGLDRLSVMTQALDDATRRVSRYLLLQLLVNACFGILYGIGLYLIGVPYAPLWGSLTAILRIVPYVGSPVAALLPLVLSLAVSDHWLTPVLVLLWFATLELVVSNFLEPWLYGVQTGISSLALLLTTVFWAGLWGPAGLILSTPLTVCVVVLGRYVPQLSFLHVLLGDEPALEAEALVYLRLLAMDEQEARIVVNRYLAKHTLAQLYDSVIIPVLTMAEHDRHKGALDTTREDFVFLNVKEMLAEFSEKTPRAPAANRESPAWTGRVLCLPANDEADEIAAAMLAQLLERTGCASIAFPFDPSLQHLLELVEPGENDVFCISALPPFAFASARTLNQQLKIRFPRTKIVVGVWGYSGDIERAVERFQPSPPERLLTRLADVVRFVMDPTRGKELSAREAAD